MPTNPILAALQDRLTTDPDNAPLVNLDSSSLPPTEAGADEILVQLQQDLQITTLTINRILTPATPLLVVSEDGESLTIEGSADILGDTNTVVTAVFTVSGDSVLKLDFLATGSFALADFQALEDKLHTENLAHHLPDLLTGLVDFTASEFSFTFDPSNVTPNTHKLSLSLGTSWNILPGKLTLNNFTFELESIIYHINDSLISVDISQNWEFLPPKSLEGYLLDTSGVYVNPIATVFRGIIRGTVELGTDFPVDVEVYITSNGNFLFSVSAGSTQPTIEIIADFLGDDANNILDTLPQAIRNMGNFSLNNVQIGVNMESPSLEYLGFTIQQSAPWVIITDILEVSDWIIEFYSDSDNGSWNYSGLLQGIIQLVSLPLQVSIAIPISNSVIIQTQDSIALPSLGEFTDFLGGEDLTNLLPGTIGEIGGFTLDGLELDVDIVQTTITYFSFALHSTSIWTVIPGQLVLRNITVSMSINDSLSSQRQIVGQVHGQIDIGEVLVDVSVQRLNPQDDWTFLVYADSISLPRPGDLTSLAGKGIPELLPKNLKAAQFSIFDLQAQVNLTTEKLEYIGFNLASWNPLELIPDQLQLDDVGVSLSLDRQTGRLNISGSMTSAFSIVIDDVGNTIVILLSATYPGTDGGWNLYGTTDLDQPLPIGNLITDIVTKFGVTDTIPAPINSLSLQNLAMSFNTQSEDFSFSGESLFNIGGTDFDITVQVDIIHLQDGTSDKSFSGSLTLGSSNPRTFRLSFAGNIMLASYSDSAGADGFDVGDLINSMLPTPTVPSGLTIALNNAFMAYMNSEFVFCIDIGNGIDLSNLPLVGKFFPRDKTVRLSYQLQYGSATFTSADVSAINAVLPLGVHPLLTNTNGEMPSGLTLAVSMQIGESMVTFDLDLAASGSSNDPNVDTYATNPDGTKAIPANQDPVVSQNSGGSDTPKWFDIQKSLGPVHFNRIGVAYNSGTLTFTLDASFSLGGLEISLAGLSVSSPLTRFEPHFDLSGLGISYSNAVMEIGGAFLKEHIGNPAPEGYDEFDGATLLKMEELALGAIGSYAYVNGEPSLFIYTALDYPIGGPPFFFVTGLSFGFGYNRSLQMPSVGKVLEFPLVAEAISGSSLPANAGKTELTAELEAIHSYIPVSVGDMFLAAGICYTTFKLVDTTILLAASFGNRFELDVLGVSTLVVPPEANKTALAVVQMTLKGSFIPDEGFVGLSGQLTSASYILSKNCHLSGGYAYYAWYGGQHKDDFVVTIGGYHRHFKKPDHYPTVPRLSFNWRLDSHTKIKGDAYFALCPHALMAGGHLEATYKKGHLKAWFKASADFLVSWKPYHYEASVHVHVGGSYTYHFFGTHHISVDVGADVKLWGPEFGGHARIKLSICSINVDFGSSKGSRPGPISWASFNSSFLPQSNLCSVTVSSGMVSKGSGGNDLGVVNPKELILLTDAFIPSKTVNWSTTEITNTWNTLFGIGPMDISANHLYSTQTIMVEKHDGMNWTDYSSHFAYTVKTKKVPAGLWGDKLNPGVNDAPLIDNTFSGLQIVPASGPIAGDSQIIGNDFVQYTTSSLNDAIVWETRTGFSDGGLDEATAKSAINTSIKTNATRDTLLASLGISSTIDLTDSIAGDLILAPQVEQVAL